MNKLKMLSILLIVLVSCDKEDSPNPDLSKPGFISKVIGNYNYLLKEKDYKAAYCEYLNEKITLLVTDLDGKIISRDLKLQLSDTTGRIFNRSNTPSDTSVFQWKLGYKSKNQKVEILDIVSEEKVFEIEATVSEDNLSLNWISPCIPKEIEKSYRFYFNNNIFLVFGDGYVYSSLDPLLMNWKKVEYITGGGFFSLLSTNEIFNIYDRGIDQPNISYVLLDPITGSIQYISPLTTDIVIPHRMVVTESGEYFMYNNDIPYGVLYKSAGTLLDFNEYQNFEEYGYLAGMTTKGDVVYILTQEFYLIEIDTQSGNTKIKQIDQTAFPSNIRFNGITVFDNRIFINSYVPWSTDDDKIYTVDLIDYAINVFDLALTIDRDMNFRFSVSGGNLYIWTGSPNNWTGFGNIRQWDGEQFNSINFPDFDFYTPGELRYSNLYLPNKKMVGFYRGLPIIVNGDGQIFYYPK
ncbi:hypothetical protein [Fulvivirga lutea]|uniref:Uncharacterized protein n=1 Tax=Fulvivirga lutea TaxID=2810512 RepID=A0A974WNZ9_9BACT|nr:hypothetical protein [Fulvivirga lutea]QSE98988.1 hypothetical protein JR347_07855 [Fulvivirga lutea]